MSIKNFHHYLLNQGFKEETAHQYCRVVQKHMAYGFDLNNIEHEVIQRYIYDLIINERQRSTINRTKSMLKKFYTFLKEEYNMQNDWVFYALVTVNIRGCHDLLNRIKYLDLN